MPPLQVGDSSVPIVGMGRIQEGSEPVSSSLRPLVVPVGVNGQFWCKAWSPLLIPPTPAWSGFTGVTVGEVNTHYVVLPIPVITQGPKRVDPRGSAWRRVRRVLRQPALHDSIEGSDEDLW